MKPTTSTIGYSVFDEILERIAPPVVSKCSCSHANWQHARAGDPRLETEDFKIGQCYVKGCDCTEFDGEVDEAESDAQPPLVNTTETTRTLWIGGEPDPADRLQIDVSNADSARIPPVGCIGAPVTVTDLRSGRRLVIARARCGFDCGCALELIQWLDDQVVQGGREPQPSLAVSEVRDVGVKTPHAVLLDQTDAPVALVYGRDETEARERAERAVAMLSGHTALVECLRDELEAIRVWQSARGIPADMCDGLQISAAKIQAALARVRNGQVEAVKPKTEARRHHFRSNWSGNSCEYRIKPAGYGVRGGRVYEFCNQAATAPIHFQAKWETGGDR